MYSAAWGLASIANPSPTLYIVGMSQPLLTPQASRLDRVLGPWMGTALVIGTIIGSGIFKKPKNVAIEVPEFGLALAAWVLIGVLVLMGALALAEVAVLLPRAGGNYVFLREAYGRWAGFLWGWVEFWIIRTASIAALATIFTESLHDILRQSQGLSAGHDVLTFWQRQGTTIAVIAALGLINARGTRLGGGLQVFLTTIKVGTLVCIAVLPFVFMALVFPQAAAVNFDRLQPLWPTDWFSVDWSKFGLALVGVLWAYHGWMNIVPVAEEVRNPSRNIPLALLVGSLTVMVLYVSANFAYYLVVSRNEMILLGDRPVAAEFGLRLLGSGGLLLTSAAIMISVFGSLNGNLLVGPRLLYAMGRDGLAPEFLSRLHPRWRTPAWAEAVLTGWAILLVVSVALLVQYDVPPLNLGWFTLDINVRPDADPFDVLTNYAIFGATSFETLAVASIFVLRRRYVVGGEAPYRCPLFPWLPLIYVLAMAAVLVNMFVTSRTESLAAVGFMAVGAVLYALVLAGRSPPPSTIPSNLED
jgi:APA family basic amino acid/polyamine antiporter